MVNIGFRMRGDVAAFTVRSAHQNNAVYVGREVRVQLQGQSNICQRPDWAHHQLAFVLPRHAAQKFRGGFADRLPAWGGGRNIAKPFRTMNMR